MDPVRGHVCRSCRLKLVTPSLSIQPRSFSTTTRLRIVPPESPYYVDIPSSHQAFSPYQPQPKGTLPTPRDIFPANRPEKSTPEYLASLTREPLQKNVKAASQSSSTARHKLKMANQRRTQLREGLTALQARKQADLNAMSRRSHQKQLERSKLLSQSEREDARLTNVSTPTAMLPTNDNTALSLKALEAELANAKFLHTQKLENYKNFKSAKHAAKMDALHTLYMSARSFVTTEAQMRALLAQQFEDPKRFTNEVANGDSMWQFGPPESIKDKIGDAAGKPRKQAISGEMLSSLKASSRLAMGVQAEREQVGQDQERMKKIAEKLSGGKI